MTKPKKRRYPNPLRKWTKEIESFEVFSCADGTFDIELVYAGPPMGVLGRLALANDIKRVLAKALKDAKK